MSPFSDYSTWYDKEGNPISMRRWGELFHDRSYQSVANAEFRGMSVSTVWLGLNHQWGDGPPLIFETMVFSAETEKHEFAGREYDFHPDLDEFTARHSTEAEALAYHRQVCEVLMALTDVSSVEQALHESSATLRDEQDE